MKTQLRKKALYGVLAMAMAFSFAPENHAQSMKEKLAAKAAKVKAGKGGKKKKGGNKFMSFNELDDATQVSGAYTALEKESVKINGYDRKVDQFGLKYIKEKDGKIIHKLELYYSKTNFLQYYMKENIWNKHQVRLFVLKSNSYMEAIVIDSGVIAFTSAKNSLWATPRTIENILVKDPSKLEIYDKETAKVKVDLIMMKLNSEALKKKKKEMLEYKAYKEYMNKIAFSHRLNNFVYNRKDKPAEDPKNFTKKLVMGKDIYFRGYLENPLVVSHPGAWFNFSYEMEGVKVDREQLRSTSSFFSKNIPRKDNGYQDAYCTWVHALMEKRGTLNVWDYAYIELLYQLKDKLVLGKSYQMKVTLHAYKDGENIADLATSTITLVYNEQSKKELFRNDPNNPGVFKKYEKWKDE